VIGTDEQRGALRSDRHTEVVVLRGSVERDGRAGEEHVGREAVALDERDLADREGLLDAW
jgi:hypothetical protein